MPRRITKHLAKPRQFMYLWALVIISWLGAGYMIYKNKHQIAEIKYEREMERLEYSQTKRYKVDVDTAREAYDKSFDPDEAVRDDRIGKMDRFLNMCNSASCRIVSGPEPTLDVCNNELSSSSKFHKYRVYSCSIKVSLENDEPMNCDKVTWNELKVFCERVNNI